ncbi:hypothetical protein Lal_00046845 [Lupinus albus]|nr:hypothetical protein Lal_00046845 [Lupinus albus]
MGVGWKSLPSAPTSSPPIQAAATSFPVAATKRFEVETASTLYSSSIEPPPFHPGSREGIGSNKERRIGLGKALQNHRWYCLRPSLSS